MKVGILVNAGAFWIGAHWSTYNRRWCINVLPCITVWIALRGGKQPDRRKR